MPVAGPDQPRGHVFGPNLAQPPRPPEDRSARCLGLAPAAKRLLALDPEVAAARSRTQRRDGRPGAGRLRHRRPGDPPVRPPARRVVPGLVAPGNREPEPNPPPAAP